LGRDLGHDEISDLWERRRRRRWSGKRCNRSGNRKTREKKSKNKRGKMIRMIYFDKIMEGSNA